MPQSGEWFSPRTRPEMLTSDDPLVHDKYDAPLEHVEILPGPATLPGRLVASARRVAEFIPSLGRRIVRVDDEPSRWQLAGMWTTGSAIVAGTGLAVAAVLGGAPPALTQQFDRLSVLPGLNEDPSGSGPAPAADKAAAPVRGSSSHSSSGPARDRTSASGPEVSYGGYSGIPGVPAGASVPDGVVVPGLPSSGGTGAGAPAKPSGGSTAPANPGNPAPPVENPTDPAPPVENPTDPAPPIVDPTDPAPPIVDPTDPAPPVVDPTDPAPPDTPPGTPPAEPPADSPADPPVDAPADPPPADSPADPAPVPDPQGTATPAP